MQFSSSIKQKLSQPHNVKLVLTLLQQAPAPSRHRPAKELCQRLNLRDAKGDWQKATTSKALRELQEQGLWRLPEPRSPAPRTWNPTRLNRPVPPPPFLPELLAEVRGLRPGGGGR